MTLEIATQIMDLYSESKAYLNAYEITGDPSFLFIAEDLQLDALKLEIFY